MSLRRGAGAVERGGLENRCTRERTVGSNPTLSASFQPCGSVHTAAEPAFCYLP